MITADYIDRTYKGFDAQFKVIIDVVLQNTGSSSPVWTHIPADEQLALRAVYTTWHAKHEAAEAPTRSKVDVEARVEARAVAEPKLRHFCQRYFYDVPELVTNAQLESMNLRPHDNTRTTHGEPKWRVVIEIAPSESQTHLIRWHVEENESRAVPEDCNGWVLVYTVLEAGDPVPIDPETMGHSVLVTRNPFEVAHKPEDVGKRIAYSGAFQSRNRGLKGKWSKIVVAVLS
jgi:hypothetical protein